MTKLVSFYLTNITLVVNLKDEISLRTFNFFFFLAWSFHTIYELKNSLIVPFRVTRNIR